MKKIYDPQFIYTPSHATDIRKTFKRIQEAANDHSQPDRSPPAIAARSRPIQPALRVVANEAEYSHVSSAS